ncbi:hypothetical protein R3P38DRAFT_1808633 [Favolaschia claudopus]|uniref:Uncharacterized protein n=1 Tax=Favolaschia claudopus TaxID=2862362 RepID=A0AAW0A5C6_9AGAR
MDSKPTAVKAVSILKAFPLRKLVLIVVAGQNNQGNDDVHLAVWIPLDNARLNTKNTVHVWIPEKNAGEFPKSASSIIYSGPLGYRLSACKCETLICSHRSQLPTVDSRAKNSQAKRLARGLDREPEPPLSSIFSVPREEYFQIPIEVRKSRENDEKRAEARAYAIRCEMGRQSLLDYVELKYLSAETQAREPTYHGGPTRVSQKLWCCPVRKFESRPWNPAPICGYILDLAKLYSEIPLQGSVALMETECRKIFNETICLHIREHMKGFGLDFDSNVIFLGLSRSALSTHLFLHRELVYMSMSVELSSIMFHQFVNLPLHNTVLFTCGLRKRRMHPDAPGSILHFFYPGVPIIL